MSLQPRNFDSRQQMISAPFELQYKRDTYLKNVELHHHDFYEIYFLVSGDVTYTIESKLYRVMPGDLLLISPRELHQVHIEPEMDAYERYVLWVDPQTIKKLSTTMTDLTKSFDPSSPGYGNQLRLDSENQRLVKYLMESLHRESLIQDYGSDILKNSLLTQLLVIINRLASRESCFWEEAIRTSRPVSQAISYINLHYNEPLSLDSLAEQFYVSKYHLSHEFQRLVGTGVYRYILKKRLLIARHLLADGEKPNKVFSSCGFGDYASFYRAFRSEYGMSPRTYTQICQNQVTSLSEGVNNG